MKRLVQSREKYLSKFQPLMVLDMENPYEGAATAFVLI
jgi:hypothetical protein